MENSKKAIYIRDIEFGNVVILVHSNDFNLALEYYKKHYPRWKSECSGTINHIWNHLDKVNEILDESIILITDTDSIEY